MIGDNKDAIIVIVLGPDVVDSPLHDLADTISHEVSHAIDHLADHIGEDDGFKGETRAYLTGHLVSQIFKITLSEKEKHARKTSRNVPKQKGQGSRRPLLQVDQLSVGGAGSNSVSSGAGVSGGAKNFDWQDISKADDSFFSDERTGF